MWVKSCLIYINTQNVSSVLEDFLQLNPTQLLVSNAESLHLNLKFEGIGLLQTLVRYFCPLPQVAVHEDQVSQVLQPPAPGGDISLFICNH